MDPEAAFGVFSTLLLIGTFSIGLFFGVWLSRILKKVTQIEIDSDTHCRFLRSTHKTSELIL